MENHIDLIPINDILNHSFFIPYYQRGYRWKDEQVGHLLDDIWDFATGKDTGAYYCLQPVVVKANGEEWELIDGQQRLTTIFTILSYLQSETVFSLRFDRRGANLEAKEYNKADRSDIDTYFISKAYIKIKNWFEKKKENNVHFAKRKFESNLIENTKIIWYEIKDNSDSIDIFTRLNMGKIPLTNAELIKALFLKSENFSPDKEVVRLRQIEISSEWDRMEYALQDEKFWNFLNNKENEIEPRIEFLFDTIPTKNSKSNLAAFQYYYEKLNVESKDDLRENTFELWKEVKFTFQIFQEWFEDRNLYHLIGFLVAEGESITKLKEEAKSISKSAFKKILKDKIKALVHEVEEIENLDYDDDNESRKQIKRVLLLFNIATILNNEKSNIRFPFDRFNVIQWSLEHIHAQNIEELKTERQWEIWLTTHLDSLKRIDKEKHKMLIEEIEGILTTEIKEEIFKKVIQEFKWDDAKTVMHTLSNLTLLDRDSNSVLNNSVFEVKRNKIIRLEEEGKFIPICTRNVFLKYYSEDLSQLLYWKKSDGEEYLNNIKSTLKTFLPQNNQIMAGKTYTFWNLIQDYHIQIPIIQRDYAQGRKSEKITEIRTLFTQSLYDHLHLPKALDFDFVYGQVKEIENKKYLLPLDGQQRLTTLFLLHWYLGLREDAGNEHKEVLKKFTYETRTSSREFCQALIENMTEFNSATKLTEQITDSAWFFMSWNKDPTIQSMLVMIDVLQEKFTNPKGLFEILIDKETCPVTFQFIALEDFGLTDNLYIKMNARGKQLTPFESFKARFEQFLGDKHPQLKNTFCHNIDTFWTDLFWQYTDEKNEVIDPFFMRFFNFMTEMLYYLHLPKGTLIPEKFNVNFSVIEEVYTNKENLIFLFSTLDFLEKKKKNALTSLFQTHFSKEYQEAGKINLFESEVNLFENLIVGKTPLIRERLLLFSIFRYFFKCKKSELGDNLKYILRVIRNLSIRIRQQKKTEYVTNLRVSNLPQILKGIDEKLMLPIFSKEYFSALSNIQGFAKNSLKQETLKAKVMLESSEKMELIERLEDHPFVQGTLINFRLDVQLNELQKDIDLFHSIWSLNDNGLIVRSLLSIEDYCKRIGWTGLGKSYFFGHKKRWNIIITKGRDFENTFYSLLEKLKDKQPSNLSEGLREIISEAAKNFTNEKWEYYFFKYSEMTNTHNSMYTWREDDSNFSIRNLSKNDLRSKHINPYVKTVIERIGNPKICKIKDSLVRRYDASPLRIYLSKEVNKNYIEMSCEEEEWRITFPEKFEKGVVVKKFEMTTEVYEGAEYQLLAHTEQEDRIEIAERFVEFIVDGQA